VTVSQKTIYGLTDPRTAEYRYVGAADEPLRRRYQHIWDAEHRPDGCEFHLWLAELRGLGLKPLYMPLEVADDWQEAERKWIRILREEGNRLTNRTSGGMGICDPIASTRAKMSKSQAGRRESPERIAQKSAASKGELNPFFGRRHTEEAREAISRKKKGVPSPKKGTKYPDKNYDNLRKTFILTDPNGIEHVVADLPKFCDANSLTRGNLYAVMSGRARHHKGWKARHM
jgi:hypothetical protein